MEYTIAVDVIVKREYLVEADNPEEAIIKYRNGKADRDESKSEMEDWEEDIDTARVFLANGEEIEPVDPRGD